MRDPCTFTAYTARARFQECCFTGGSLAASVSGASAVVIAGVTAVITTATAADQDENQDNDPSAIVTAKKITTHNVTSLKLGS